jgi:hypothetical protein
VGTAASVREKLLLFRATFVDGCLASGQLVLGSMRGQGKRFPGTGRAGMFAGLLARLDVDLGLQDAEHLLERLQQQVGAAGEDAAQ